MNKENDIVDMDLVCPVCGGGTAQRIVRNNTVQYCEIHKTAWVECSGYNMPSHMDFGEEHDKGEIEFFAGYKLVELHTHTNNPLHTVCVARRADSDNILRLTINSLV